ncbi:signal recognition particle-docking protein FtsY [Varibaculum cambriense]|uniref:signal recognition particle-docking protein FtsY n=1 Tax=Varibaculum cambriense TaxID=184870 RepID=UPI0028FDC4A9|nr:signal recognition particle-docking protein FtsY [Varibaculum cambriense]MDU2150619.1 signal recognition particle-docking protein FtsY [Varibaculum cambriense]MDU7412748.1 signal recognition particle-docking protein FtsY [Varibaculum cambriense]
MDFLFSPLGIVLVLLVLALVGTGGALAARSAKAKKQLETSKAKQLEATASETGEKEAVTATAEPESEGADQVEEPAVTADESAQTLAEEDAVAEPKTTEPESLAAEPSEAPALEEEAQPATQEEESAEAVLETPEPAQGRMQRLRSRLAKSGSFGKMLLGVLGRGDLSAEDWEEIEDTLLMADLGIAATDELMEDLRTQAKVLGTSDPEKIREILRAKLIELVNPDLDRSLNLEQADGTKPGIVLAVGVNGTGKTTTVGKIARILVAENKSVVLGAADTFRAAAADQLETWGNRVGVEVVRSDKEGADPASVAFDAVKYGKEKGLDVVLVDTAGRLQNKAGLMDELGKVKRVIEKSAPVTETLLVLDATTGQNGMQQAKVFSEVVDVSGIVLTKLDGTARGGIVVSVQRELSVPVKLVGLGEGPDDLAPFVPEDFVDALLK